MGFWRWFLFLISGTLLLPTAARAQEKCAFDHIYKKQQEASPGSEKSFESWMASKIRQRAGLRTQATYNIPVVVHIVHNGEPVGTGSNLSVEQVQSQIDVINKDYKRLNADQTNTPPEFAAVAGSIDVNFVLAKQDPEGLPTNGIVRVKGTKTTWTVGAAIDNGPEYKALSYWPAEDYLNIWVTTLSGDYLGIAQFPQTSLPGTVAPYDRLTDGVTIDYRVFGSIDGGAFNLDAKYNKGRTATHEIGHFFSMLHIFGEGGGCGATDYVGDTPSQAGQTLNCPTHPSISCSHPKMFQNYMDYTDDVCMNLFTAGQIARMTTVLQNSPRRASLNTSHGLLDPTVLALDLEARRVLVPLAKTCGQQLVPTVELRNRGTTTVTSAQIQLLIDGNVIETKTFSLNLPQLALTSVSFTAVNLPEPSISNVSFQITQVNGGTDNKTDNNAVSLAASVMTKTIVPFTEAFNTIPSTWQITNFDNGATWTNVVAPKSASDNRAMFLEFYNYPNAGSKDKLISNYIAIPNSGAPVLKFDRAYAQSANSNDALRVLVSVGCSSDISTATQIFSKSGTSLATTGQTSSYFMPTNDSQWATETISLAAYRGQNIQLIFESTNDFGNNLYLDNLSISAGDFNDIAITSLVQPGPVFCQEKLQPILQIQNLGSAIVNRITVNIMRGTTTLANQTFTGLSLETGASKNLTLASVNFTEGLNTITFSITNPDAPTEESPQNNTVVYNLIQNNDSFTNPLRINLDNGIAMSVVSQNDNAEWQTTATNFDNSLMYPGYTNVTIGAEAWAVTPTIDFSKNNEASMFFDTSYGKRTAADERLRVLVTEDCGLHYDSVIFDMNGSSLSNKQSDTAPWVPSVETDWTKHYVSLSYLAGKDQIRFAFVASNGHGNNLYLDNMEWFVEDDPSPPHITDFYSVYSSEFDPYDFFITFNLPEKLTARLAVYNTIGQVLVDNLLPETLNQTYTVNLTGQSTGVYLVRLQAGDQVSTTKLFVGR